jgi:hypothetical protein
MHKREMHTKILVEKPEGKRALRSVMNILKNNIRNGSWEGVHCIYLAQDRDQ